MQKYIYMPDLLYLIPTVAIARQKPIWVIVTPCSALEVAPVTD